MSVPITKNCNKQCDVLCFARCLSVLAGYCNKHVDGSFVTDAETDCIKRSSV